MDQSHQRNGLDYSAIAEHGDVIVLPGSHEDGTNSERSSECHHGVDYTFAFSMIKGATWPVDASSLN